MKKIFVLCMLVCGIIVFSGVSHAESYVSAYIGDAIPHDSDVTDNTGLGVSGQISLNSGLALGAKLGHWFNEQNAPFFGLQLDLNGHFPKTDKLTVLGVNIPIDADVNVYSATANALVRYPEGAIRPYAGVGGGWFNGEIKDGNIAGIPFKGESDSVFGWQLLAGVDFLINPNFSLFAEYKYSGANFKFGGDIGLDVDYRVSQVYAGASYLF